MATEDAMAHLPVSPKDYELLFSLSRGDKHGYGLVVEIEERTRGLISFEPANLYRSLRRLSERGLVARGAKEPSVGGPDRRYYRLTELGQRVFVLETRRLRDLVYEADRDGLPSPEPRVP